ncbi:TetR-like C-terminal domain-containing protein [Fructilactobacillus sp. Tb1]|uniref:TetR-like C-terminal domain-containing protein n=1 Tax=Fructilactobacillus sp. Tb1 TaxID=3422304 RepID=UPI003D287245
MLKKDIISKEILNQAAHKPLYKITSSSIIKETGIARKTFYNNFNNIDDAIEYLFESIDNNIFDAVIYDKNISSREAISMLINVFPKKIYAKRDAIKILYTSELNGKWTKFLENRYKKMIVKYVFKDFSVARQIISKEDAANFYTRSFLALLETWMSKPIPEKPEIFITHFELLFNTSLNQLANI